MRSTERDAGRVELGLGDRRLADEHAAIVHVIIQAAHDAAGVGLHEHAMAAGRLDVEPDVVVVGVEQVPHRDVAEDDLAVGRGGPGRREGAAMRFLGPNRPLLGRLAESPAFQAGRRGLEGVFEKVGLDVGVDRDEVEQIERPAVPLGAGRRGPVGDSLHLLEVFGVESAQEQGIGQQPQVLPGVGGGLGAAIPGDLADEPGDLGRHQPAVLVAPLVRLSLDVQHDPAGLRVAITRPEPLHRGRVAAEKARRWHRSRDRPARR